MNSISMKIKSYYRKRLFMKIYFSILNHPKTEPCDALGLATEQFQGIMSILHPDKA